MFCMVAITRLSPVRAVFTIVQAVPYLASARTSARALAVDFHVGLIFHAFAQFRPALTIFIVVLALPVGHTVAHATGLFTVDVHVTRILRTFSD